MFSTNRVKGWVKNKETTTKEVVPEGSKWEKESCKDRREVTKNVQQNKQIYI